MVPVSVAVVIPLYNHERYIGEALRSVLAQTRPADRVIVLDDGSSDGSLAAAQAIADPRLTVLTQPNAGAHETLNRAIALAPEAEFIAILNSDDLYEPARLETCLGFLEEHPETDVICTRLRLIDEEGELLPASDPKARWLRSLWQARPGSLPEWLGIANFTKTTSNLVGRSAYFRSHPFRPYRFVHDYFFAVTASLEGRLAVVEEELLRYRTHAGNTIKSGPAAGLTREVLRMNLDLLRIHAAALEASPEMRARCAGYFRLLARNHADFRLEPFLALLARQLAALPDAAAEQLCSSLSPEQFPELLAGKSPALREAIALADYQRELQAIAASRWLALGRLFGGGLPVLNDAPTAEARLAALRKVCAASSWHQLGCRLGFVYSSPETNRSQS